MKTIMMTEPHIVRYVTAFKAEEIAHEHGARLPTVEEYDLLYKIQPWPHVVWEWTSTEDEEGLRLLRGGSWDSGPGFARAPSQGRENPAYLYTGIGLRFAKDIPDDEPVPEGWVAV